MLLKRKTLIRISIALVLVIALAVTLWGLFSPKRLTHILPDEHPDGFCVFSFHDSFSSPVMFVTEPSAMVNRR